MHLFGDAAEEAELAAVRAERKANQEKMVTANGFTFNPKPHGDEHVLDRLHSLLRDPPTRPGLSGACAKGLSLTAPPPLNASEPYSPPREEPFRTDEPATYLVPGRDFATLGNTHENLNRSLLHRRNAGGAR